MSNLNHLPGPIVPPEIPRVGNALEVPNYVIPTTDLEYREINDEVDPRSDDCRDAEKRGGACRG